VTLAAARLLAEAIRSLDGSRMAVSEHFLVVREHGQLWMRRHDWNADQWAPIALPGAATERSSHGSEPGKPKPARRGSRR
jgi:hypothetical protein